MCIRDRVDAGGVITEEVGSVVGVDWSCPSLCVATPCGALTFAESELLQPQINENRIKIRDERRTTISLSPESQVRVGWRPYGLVARDSIKLQFKR